MHPLLAGQLRFRLTPDRLPQSFSQGEDCLTPEEDVWKIPLIVLHHFESYRHIYRQLRLDGFVSDALHLKLANLEFIPRNTRTFLHSLHQVFPVDFAASYLRFFVVEGELVLRHNPHGEAKLLCLNVDRGTPRRSDQTFSHPDALPLLLANTFGDKHKRL